MNFMELGLDAVGIVIYKFLDSMLHPAGAFPSVKTAFLTILSIHFSTFNNFIQYLSNYKPCISNVHPAGAFFFVKIAALEISSMDFGQNQSCFPRRVQFRTVSFLT